MLLFTLLGCPAPPPPPDACAAVPDWDTFASGYVRTWCTGCHTANLGASDRAGAPLGVDFDRWSDVYAWRDRIMARATGPTYDMPPLGAVPPQDVSRFAQWLACGAVGSDPVPHDCTTGVGAGDRLVSTPEEAVLLCEAGNRVGELTISTSVDLSCVCSITGALQVTGGAVTLGSLTEIGGSLFISGEATGFDAPVLDSIGGDLTVTGPLLADLTLPWLRTVHGALTVSSDGLTALSLPDLTTAGALTVVESRALVALDVPRLREVEGDVEVARLPLLEALTGTRTLAHIGGALRLQDLPRLRTLDRWSFLLLSQVDTVDIRRNNALAAIDGFTLLPTARAITVTDNGALLRIDGFDNLVNVETTLQISGNARQENVLGFINLEGVGATLAIQDLPALRSLGGFGVLSEVGALDLRGLGPPALPWFTELQTVHGTFVIDAWPTLAAIPGLSGMQTVGGALTVTNNLSLSTALVTDWIAGIPTVTGPVTVSGNALP